MKYYNKYSEYLKNKYGEKVYKLPINLPLTCPNRLGSRGCSFCSEVGTGFEAMSNHISVTDQLNKTKSYIGKRYNAHKYIAYFQNFTNTFLPIEDFEKNLIEAAQVDDIVEISISTRPDCIRNDYLDVMKKVSERYSVHINIELGLQTANYNTLIAINRGHTLTEYIDAMLMIKPYNFTTCTHVIINLPNDSINDVIETAKIVSVLKSDIVKIHSLYIAKGTKLCEDYQNGAITICSMDEYIERLIVFIEHLNPDIIVERLFSRIPKEDMEFSNWGTSWWKLQDIVLERMAKNTSYQGKKYCYLNGQGLKKLH